MKSGWRIIIAAAAAAQVALATPVLAQNAVTPAPAQQGNSTDVGPAQLRDFTLNGTVTRAAPARPQPQPQPSAQPPASTAQPPAQRPSVTTALPPARPAAPATAGPLPAPPPTRGSVTVPLPEVSAAAPGAAASAGQDFTAAPALPQPDPAPSVIPQSSAIPDGMGLLPWLLAALVIGAGAAYYLFRVRPRALAGGPSEAFDLAEAPPAPPPAPEPSPSAVRPRPVMPQGDGLVSTSLRPWVEVEFIPERTIVEEEQVTIEFVLALYNSGSAPARDLVVECAMFNASRDQDQRIRAFFAEPAGRGNRIDMVAPLQRISVRGSVSVARSEIQPLMADGRPLLVPITALNVLYRWGSRNNGQTSVSHLVGKETKGDKLAPFRLDIGARQVRGLGAREHAIKVRN